MRSGRGETDADAWACSRRSSGVTVRGTGQPGLCMEYCARFQSIQARQSCGAWATGEPTTGGGEVGRGGEERLPRTDEIEGAGEGGRDKDAMDASSPAWNLAIVCAKAADIRGETSDPGGGETSVKEEEALGSTEVEPESPPGASEEGLGRTSPLSSGFLAPTLGAGVLRCKAVISNLSAKVILFRPLLPQMSSICHETKCIGTAFNSRTALAK